MKSLFIVFEGAEGSGKSSQVTRLKEYLAEKHPDREVVFTREPGGTHFADRIRELLVSPEAERANGLTLFGLVTASRSDHVAQVVRPSLAAGKTVISDRYLASTYAYQVVGQESPELEELFWKCAERFPVPDAYIYLAVTPELGRERVDARDSHSHFHDRPLAFYERVRAGYQTYFEKAGIQPITIDSNQDLETVWKEVQEKIESLLTQAMI